LGGCRQGERGKKRERKREGVFVDSDARRGGEGSSFEW
jgi:hypothetical protein